MDKGYHIPQHPLLSSLNSPPISIWNVPSNLSEWRVRFRIKWTVSVFITLKTAGYNTSFMKVQTTDMSKGSSVRFVVLNLPIIAAFVSYLQFEVDRSASNRRNILISLQGGSERSGRNVIPSWMYNRMSMFALISRTNRSSTYRLFGYFVGSMIH